MHALPVRKARQTVGDGQFPDRRFLLADPCQVRSRAHEAAEIAIGIEPGSAGYGPPVLVQSPCAANRVIREGSARDDMKPQRPVHVRRRLVDLEYVGDLPADRLQSEQLQFACDGLGQVGEISFRVGFPEPPVLELFRIGHDTAHALDTDRRSRVRRTGQAMASGDHPHQVCLLNNVNQFPNIPRIDAPPAV